MKHKKALFLTALLATVFLAGQQPTQAKNEPLTLLVIPSRYPVVQLSFDIIRSFPTILLAYEGDASSTNTQLYVWNDVEWFKINSADYNEAKFATKKPERIILVGDKKLLPPLFVEGSSWCPSVWNVTTTDTTELINAMGRIYKFNENDWLWYAKRYNLTIKNLNKPIRTTSWYDGSLLKQTDVEGNDQLIYRPPQNAETAASAP